MSTIILASQSPRRKELLQQLNLTFSIQKSGADETIVERLKPEDFVLELAKRKAVTIAKQNPNDYVIGSDTIVTYGDEILEKPGNNEEAIKMLKMLSGRTHSVYTGVAIFHKGEQTIFCEKTDVTFWELSKEEIDSYIESGEPFDKAGGYGIQGLGAMFVKEIKGDYYTVVGLPLSKVYRELKRMGYRT
ncbi:Maf family protein [Bacillus seohaeanensis]|uniref:dTTP/UTP pyrophosphatase n=1 Tax=Bacillus seohaeanensis TaxID=284580 RepID=A0ABW5RRX4_9BACI